MNTQTQCILQVEDEDADIDLIRFAFQKSGIDGMLKAVTDGDMAISYLSGAGPHADRKKYPLPCVILLDLKLPKLSGLEVLAWLRQQPTLKHIVVVILSSSAEPHDLERAYALGANSFVQKPAGLQITIELVQTFKAWWLGFNRFADEIPTRPRPSSRI
jgi:CheY-like chemotaxis protein